MKLSPAQVLELIDAWQEGTTQTELALRFGVGQPTVGYHIRRYVGAKQGETVRRSGVDSATLADVRRLAEEALKAQIYAERRLRGLLAALGPREKSVSSENREGEEAENTLLPTA